MRSARAWMVRLWSLLDGQRRERDLAQELESHVQLHIDDNVRAGMSAVEARRQYGVSAADPITLATVSTVLLSVGTLATLVPAWRAAHVDPFRTLRDE